MFMSLVVASLNSVRRTIRKSIPEMMLVIGQTVVRPVVVVRHLRCQGMI